MLQDGGHQAFHMRQSIIDHDDDAIVWRQCAAKGRIMPGRVKRLANGVGRIAEPRCHWLSFHSDQLRVWYAETKVFKFLRDIESHDSNDQQSRPEPRMQMSL